MPVYHHLGEVPSKRHKIHRKTSGSLYSEELVGNMGFTGPSSLLYHISRPTAVLALRTIKDVAWNCAIPEPLRHRHFRTNVLERRGDPAIDRIPLLFNDDVSMAIAYPGEEESKLYRNAQGDEVVYISEGEGTL